MRTAFLMMCALVSVILPDAAARAKRDVVGYVWVPEKDTSPYWTLADNANAFSTIAPTWLSFGADGKLVNRTDTRMLKWAKGRGLKVTPLVANSPFKPETARPIIEDDEAVKSSVAALLDAVQSMDADGLNVDIEGVAPTDRARYNVFIAALCEAFHRNNLIVTVDLPAKTSDAPASAWAGWADYAFIGRHVDQAQLMCYDEHWSGGSPGPIASIPWVRRVLEYAVTYIPREKIVLGMPFYGYDWPAEGSASEVTGVRAAEMIRTLGVQPQWDHEAQSAWFTYTGDIGKRTVYYETSRTLKARLDLAREFKLAGVSIWRLGDESPDFWPLLKRYREGR